MYNYLLLNLWMKGLFFWKVNMSFLYFCGLAIQLFPFDFGLKGHGLNFVCQEWKWICNKYINLTNECNGLYLNCCQKRPLKTLSCWAERCKSRYFWNVLQLCETRGVYVGPTPANLVTLLASVRTWSERVSPDFCSEGRVSEINLASAYIQMWFVVCLYVIHVKTSNSCWAGDGNHDLLVFGAGGICSYIISSKIISPFIAICDPIWGCLFIPVSYWCLL